MSEEEFNAIIAKYGLKKMHDRLLFLDKRVATYSRFISGGWYFQFYSHEYDYVGFVVSNPIAVENKLKVETQRIKLSIISERKNKILGDFK